MPAGSLAVEVHRGEVVVDGAQRAEAYRALFDALEEGIVFQDRDGRVVFANPAAGRILGLPVEQLVGQTSRDERWHAAFEGGAAAQPEEHPAVVTRLTGKPQRDVGMQVTRGDGSVVWVSINTRAVPTPDGTGIAGVVVSFADVTRRREAEERVRSSEARLRGLLHHSSDIVVVVDTSGVLSYVSESTQRVLGYRAEEWVGRAGLDLIHPDDRAQAVEALTDTAADPGLTAPMELRVSHADGSWHIVEVVANNLLDDPALAGIVVNVRDITDLRSAHHEITASARRFDAMLANLSDVVSVIDAEGRLTYVSPNIEWVLGRRAEDRYGASIFDYIHPDDQGPVLEKLAEGLEKPGPSERFEARLLHGDGKYRVWEVAAVNMLDDPDVRGIVVNSRDVTDRVDAEAALRRVELERHRREVELERHRLEAQLARAQRLESLGALAGGIAHDFNNLLAVILNYAIFAARSLDPESALAADVAQIQRAAEQAAELTGKLVMFGRSDEHEPAVADLNAIVEDAVRLVERSTGPRTRLVTALEPLPCFVCIDRGQIEQALVNLILNADDALPGGGTITVTTTTTPTTTTTGDPGTEPDVVLIVADDGVGMAAEVVERVFEPFFSTKGAGYGSGLGLAIAHNVIARAGGEIAIESHPGAGTMVRVTLPGALIPGEPGSGETPMRPDGGGETVLLVEDDASVRALTDRILTEAGYTVIVTDSGAAALDALGAAPHVALLLTDVVMPAMSGVEVAERARELRPDLPVVFMTAYAHNRLTSLREGAVVIRKPFTPDRLLETVRTKLDRSPSPAR